MLLCFCRGLPQDIPGEHESCTNLAGLSLGLAIQFLVVLTAQNSRSVEITPASIQDWVAQFPKAVLTLLPEFAEIGERGQLADSAYSPNVWIGFLTLVLWFAFSGYLLSRKSPQLKGAGWLLITGYLIGVIPAVTNYPINRYFVVPIITLAIALFIWLGSVFTGKYSIIASISLALIFLAWLPDFGLQLSEPPLRLLGQTCLVHCRSSADRTLMHNPRSPSH